MRSDCPKGQLRSKEAAQGQLTSVQILRDSESLASAAVAAVRQWRFVPGKHGGAETDSPAIMVMVFRYSGEAQKR
jgi:outer membrane biosynthesis protein TonB